MADEGLGLGANAVAPKPGQQGRGGRVGAAAVGPGAADDGRTYFTLDGSHGIGSHTLQPPRPDGGANGGVGDRRMTRRSNSVDEGGLEIEAEDLRRGDVIAIARSPKGHKFPVDLVETAAGPVGLAAAFEPEEIGKK